MRRIFLTIGIIFQSVIFYGQAPMLVHEDAATQREFQNVYQQIGSISTESSNPNILINGGFEIWQRGLSTGPWTGQGYTADRWSWAIGGTATVIISTSTILSDDFGTYSMKLIVSATSGGINVLQQAIENYKDYRGKTLTASIRIKCSVVGAFRLNIQDSGNNYSVVNGGTDWETLTVTRVVDTAATSLRFEIGMRSPAGQVSTTYLDNAIMVVGSEPTPFVPRPYAQELALAQRYYEKSYAIDTPPGTATGTNVEEATFNQLSASEVYSGTIKFKVTKYSLPTVTVYLSTGTAGQWTFYQATGSSNARVVSTGTTRQHGFHISNGISVSDTFGYGHWTAESEM